MAPTPLPNVDPDEMRPFAGMIEEPENEKLYKTTAPKFGKEMLKYFAFDKGYRNLNNGSYGVLPEPVRRSCDALSRTIEGNPDKFIRLTYLELMINTRARLTQMIGADSIDEVVLVNNASHGINTVLRNFEWKAGDVIIDASTTYNSIRKTVQYLSDVPPHPEVCSFEINMPATHATVVANWRKYIETLVQRLATQPVKPTHVVAVIDAISSKPGVVLPWKEMVKVCKEHAIWTVVDGAHSIGQEQNIEVAKSGCDFWVSNCYKWLMCKRSCTILYVPKRNQLIVKSSIPTSAFYISPTDPKFIPGVPNMVPQFQWNGCMDLVPDLTVGATLDFRNWLGGEKRINEYCHDLAVRGGKRMAQMLKGEVMVGKDEHELCFAMVNVSLPLPPTIKYDLAMDTYFRDRLLNGFNTYVTHYPHNGKIWMRACAQVWNDITDFEYAAQALQVICDEIIVKWGGGKPV